MRPIRKYADNSTGIVKPYKSIADEITKYLEPARSADCPRMDRGRNIRHGVMSEQSGKTISVTGTKGFSYINHLEQPISEKQSNKC
jgi:hypothetical protein